MNAGEQLYRDAMAQLDLLLTKPPSARDALLLDLAQAQPALHALVVSLLKAEREASGSGFLEVPTLKQVPAIQPDQRLGAYQIVRKLGEGGMGQVWLARRIDGSHGGDVAIKTLHPHLANTQLRERFTREAHILGKLAHKNIARLLDGGVADDGVAYLVLEYVHGESLDAWCDARSLPIRARLELFLSVCQAVAHAHANLVVHRDLKPSNILVAQNGAVKLLDFGVAKLVQGDDTDVEPTALTQFGGRIFTPEYAAPEQILGEPVTTATDVYALGVVLYALLSGKRPFGGNTGTARELEQAILHKDPAALSLLPSDNATTIATARATTPAKLQRVLAGDLEFIVARALRKSPKDRYGSALALAVDIERYMQQQPIEARAGSSGYRVSRFVRRHRAATVATLVSVSALLIGAGTALWQARIASAEAMRANAVRDFLLDIFQQNSILHPDGARARSTTAEELLAIGADRIRTQLSDVPDARADMLGSIADMYGQLELADKSTPLYEQQLATLRELYGNDDLRTARAMTSLGLAHAYTGSYDIGKGLLMDAVRVMEKQPEEAGAKLGSALIGLGHISYRMHSAAGDAAERFAAARDVFAKYAPNDPERPQAHYGLAHVAEADNDHDVAERHYRAGIALAESSATGNFMLAGGYQQLGDFLRLRREYSEGLPFTKKALETFEATAGADHPFTADARKEYANFLATLGEREAARAEYERAIDSLVRTRGALDAELTANSFSEYGGFLFVRGELGAARQQLERSIAASRAKDPHGPFLITAMGRLVRVEIYDGKLDQAQKLADEFRELVRAERGEQHRTFGLSRAIDAELLTARGKAAQAIPIFVDVLATWPPPETEVSPLELIATPGLVRAAIVGGQSGKAEQAARTLYDRVHSIPPPAQASLDEQAIAALRLGQALCAQGRLDAAQPLLTKAVALREGLDGAKSVWTAEAHASLARCRS